MLNRFERYLEWLCSLQICVLYLGVLSSAVFCRGQLWGLFVLLIRADSCWTVLIRTSLRVAENVSLKSVIVIMMFDVKWRPSSAVNIVLQTKQRPCRMEPIPPASSGCYRKKKNWNEWWKNFKKHFRLRKVSKLFLHNQTPPCSPVDEWHRLL